MRLELENVRAGYGSLEVLRGIDLVVPDGAAVALLGANGAGKTTTLRVCAGLLRPSTGVVRLDGRELDGARPSVRTRDGLCLIPEGRAIFRRLTVRQNIAMQVGGRKITSALEKAAAFFPILGQRLDQLAGTLSGGEQQMLAVARALVTDARLVMADELSVGLAPIVVDVIFDAVRSLRSEGRSLLIVEQYIERALDLADYVYVLHKGTLVFVGEPSQARSGDVLRHYLGSEAGQSADLPAAAARRPATRKKRASDG
jgi:branched-chain amino acid transport system ATP-binding protein